MTLLAHRNSIPDQDQQVHASTGGTPKLLVMEPTAPTLAAHLALEVIILSRVAARGASWGAFGGCRRTCVDGLFDQVTKLIASQRPGAKHGLK